jgi:hypothetical protein
MDTGRSIADESPLPPPSNQRNQSTSKTLAIPIPNYIKRTDSEQLLCEEEAFADYRDFAMYNRVVTGMIRQHEHAIAIRPASRSLDSLYETGACIANIQRNARARDANDCVSLYSEHHRTNHPTPSVQTGDDAQVGFLAPTFPVFHDVDEGHVFSLDL